jgi:hypothetical protein
VIDLRKMNPTRGRIAELTRGTRVVVRGRRGTVFDASDIRGED